MEYFDNILVSTSELFCKSLSMKLSLWKLKKNKNLILKNINVCNNLQPLCQDNIIQRGSKCPLIFCFWDTFGMYLQWGLYMNFTTWNVYIGHPERMQPHRKMDNRFSQIIIYLIYNTYIIIMLYYNNVHVVYPVWSFIFCRQTDSYRIRFSKTLNMM